MKPDQIYHELKNLADKLSITVIEKNFRNTGIKVKSGLCKVKDKDFFYMDKHISVYKKNQILAECLAKMPLEDIYIVPFIREFLEKHSD
ncbi:Uncharacterized protein dnl_27250 [Desulfonema limicola]|uniref:Uncharacterized protein n=1 Tax=Desulfonema limicola TaxID=45656 RepID=A0A975B7R1_9BACT|nr:hypothetical protein [Desulfonema limicola]QTA80422.1 Uncharacterized protein dnl_27250 [Desulfonema limicola]